jgi:hypothetical protein
MRRAVLHLSDGFLPMRDVKNAPKNPQAPGTAVILPRWGRILAWDCVLGAALVIVSMV